jgi:hypothetical protein
MFGKEVGRMILGHEEIELQIFEENYIRRTFMIFNVNVTFLRLLNQE